MLHWAPLSIRFLIWSDHSDMLQTKADFLDPSACKKGLCTRVGGKWFPKFTDSEVGNGKEILNVKCLEYSSPAWEISVLSHYQAIKCAKARVCVYADSVLCGTDAQKRKQGGQVEGYSSNLAKVGANGEANEFEGIQKDLARKNIKPEEFKDWTIFISMLKDENVFRILRMSRSTRWNSRKDFRTLLGRGSEEKWHGKSCDNLKGGLWFCRQHKGTAIQRIWSSYVQKNQCIESWDPLKETLKKPYISMEIPQKEDSCFEQFFLWISSAFTEQWRIGVINSAWQWEDKGRVNLFMDNKMLTNVPLEEVQLMVSLPTMALGNRIRERCELSSRIQFTRLCQNAPFQNRETAGKMYKIQIDGSKESCALNNILSR